MKNYTCHILAISLFATLTPTLFFASGQQKFSSPQSKNDYYEIEDNLRTKRIESPEAIRQDIKNAEHRSESDKYSVLKKIIRDKKKRNEKKNLKLKPKNKHKNSKKKIQKRLGNL